MSFPDEFIYLAFELVTEVDLTDLDKEIKKDPMKEKKRLAFEIVKMLWGKENAEKSQEEFETTFQKRQPEYTREVPTQGNLLETIAPILGSKSEAKRLISQDAVDINGETIDNAEHKIKSGDKIKIGKRIFVKIKTK